MTHGVLPPLGGSTAQWLNPAQKTMASLLDLFRNSLQPVLDQMACQGFNPYELLLAVAGFDSQRLVVETPFLNRLLIPQGCAPTPPFALPTFSGGQCEGAVYNVQTRTRQADGSTFDLQISSLEGPILGATNRWEWFGGFNAGPFPFIRVEGPNIQSGQGFTEFGPLQVRDVRYVTRTWITTVQRVDGQPDDCGSPQRPFRPPIPGTIGPQPLPPFNVEIPGIGPVSFSTQVTFSPAVNIPIQGGIHFPLTLTIAPNIMVPTQINVPVYLRFPSLEINPALSFEPSLDITPQIDFPSGGGIEIPFVSRIIGCNVQSNIATGSPVSQINGIGDAPNLYVPRLATVRFTSPAFAGARQSIDIDVKTLNQFVPCPWFYGAVDYTVLPNVGVTVTSAPVTALVADLVKSG